MKPDAATKVYRADGYFLIASLLYFLVPASMQFVALSHLVMDTPMLVVDKTTHHVRPASAGEMVLFIGLPLLFEAIAIRLFLFWKNGRIEYGNERLRILDWRRKITFQANVQDLTALPSEHENAGVQISANGESIQVSRSYRNLASLLEELQRRKREA